MTTTENPDNNQADQSQEPDNSQSELGDESTIRLSTPWGRENIISTRGKKLSLANEYTYSGSAPAEARAFITERTQLHQTYIQEEAKTKRLWLILSVVSLLVALTLMIFAPEGRQTLSYWIGGALLIFAAGAAGYKRVWGKSSIFSVGADQDRHENI